MSAHQPEIRLARGQVHWVELDPVRGSEMSKTRPCVILSANEINRRRRTVVIVPLTTTRQAAQFPLLIEVPSAGTTSKMRPEQLRSVDRERFLGRCGQVTEHDLDLIGRAVAKVLDLPAR
jgi:mRNA interferase MazF